MLEPAFRLSDEIIAVSLRSQLRCTFFSLIHIGTTQGLPFFQLAYDPGNDIHIIGPKRAGTTLLECLERQMLPPPPCRFPAAAGEICDRFSGETLQVGIPGLCASIESPQRYGYRIEHDGRSLAYCLDHEHGDTNDIHLTALAQNADMLVFDAAYTDEEYPSFRGWAIQLAGRV